MNAARTSCSSAWLVVALLWPVALLNYLDRQMLATMGLSIKADIVALQSAEKFGQLMAIFMWVYAFCSPLGGFIADRLNRKWLIVFSLGIWSGVTLLMGTASNFEYLYYLRAIMGVSEAFYIPAGLALIADYHPGPTRSLAVGIHMSGIYMGQALGGVGGWVAQEISWRAAFASCGVIGVVYALVLVMFLREKRGQTAPQPRSRPSAQGTGSVHWLGYVILLLCFALPSLPGWAVKNWLPTLLQDRFAMAQAPSGLVGHHHQRRRRLLRRAHRGTIGRSLDPALDRRPHLRQWAGSSANRAGPRRNGARAKFSTGDSLHCPLRPGVWHVRRQQHAHPVPGGSAASPRHRLRRDELLRHRCGRVPDAVPRQAQGQRRAARHRLCLLRNSDAAGRRADVSAPPKDARLRTARSAGILVG